MDLKVVRGKTISLPAEFFLGDDPVDPEDSQVRVVDPSGETVVGAAVPVRDARGRYRYDYPVPAGAPLGTWGAIWTAMIDGTVMSGADWFEVREETPRLPSPASDLQPLEAPEPATVEDHEEPLEPAPDFEPLEAPEPAPGLEPLEAPEPAPGLEPLKAPEPATAVDGEKQLEPAPAEDNEQATEASPPGPAGVKRGRRTRVMALLILGAVAAALAVIWFLSNRQDPVLEKIDRGVGFQNAGRIEEARRLYEQALTDDPDNTVAPYNLGVVAHNGGRMAEAEGYYRKSLSTDPDFLPALHNLAILLEQEGRNEETADTYRHILNRYPDNAAAHLNFGLLLIRRMDRVDEGRAELRRAVELQPELAAVIPAERQ